MHLYLYPEKRQGSLAFSSDGHIVTASSSCCFWGI